LTLESPDGTLSCTDLDGKPCSAEQVRSLDQHVAAPERCDIRVEYSRPSTGNTTSSTGNTASTRTKAH
jgi:hypothetical protein